MDRYEATLEDSEMQNVEGQTASSNDYESLATSMSSDSAISWIAWFCSLPGNEFFVEIPEDFIEDDFNLFGLNSTAEYYNEALDTILDLELDDNSFKSDEDGYAPIERAAENLYGLIHARYIITKQGLGSILYKFESQVYGTCPRVLCNNASLLPAGLHDVAGKDTVKLFCGCCGDLYQPRDSRHAQLDGAYFGTTLPHIFYLTYPESIPRNSIIFPQSAQHDPPNPPQPPQPQVGLSDSEESEVERPTRPTRTEPQETPLADPYEPKVFGFKVGEAAKSGPRMKWLRSKQEK